MPSAVLSQENNFVINSKNFCLKNLILYVIEKMKIEITDNFSYIFKIYLEILLKRKIMYNDK